MRFNAEARRTYLDFATSALARWPGNFRELSASVTRMATLADSGRIGDALVAEEVDRLRATWADVLPDEAGDLALRDLLGEAAGRLDLFDRAQRGAVVEACRATASLSEAGRRLFAVSRLDKKLPNDLPESLTAWRGGGEWGDPRPDPRVAVATVSVPVVAPVDGASLARLAVPDALGEVERSRLHALIHKVSGGG